MEQVCLDMIKSILTNEKGRGKMFEILNAAKKISKKSYRGKVLEVFFLMRRMGKLFKSTTSIIHLEFNENGISFLIPKKVSYKFHY